MRCILLAVLLQSISFFSHAHQPVMDMAPRWEDGYGFQVRHEDFGSSKLKQGADDISNPLGLRRHLNLTWFEGVYTFKPAYRVTFKLPYIDQSRVVNINGQGVAQNNKGIGDLVVSFPIKKYKNYKANTSNIGITPAIRVPTGSSSGVFPISDGSWDAGLSVSYSYEGFPFKKADRLKIYQMYDFFYWHNTKGHNGMRAGHEVGLDLNFGIHPLHNDQTNSGLFLLWDVTARYNGKPSSNNLTIENEGKRVHTGPVVILYKENIMFRAEYKLPVYENVSGIALSRGDEINIGIGITF